MGPTPYEREYHTMASDGTRVFLLGGYSPGVRAEISFIHVFDTSMYVRFVISSGQPSKLRTQRTLSTRIARVTLSILMRRPSNLRGGHLQVPQPRSNYGTRNPLHQRPTMLPIYRTLPPLYQAARPLCRLLTSKTPVRMVGRWNSRV